MYSAVCIAGARAVNAVPVASTIRTPEAGGALGDIAVSEGVVNIISSAAHGDNDDDNDDDDDQEGDADAERAADTASAETGLSSLGSFVTG